MSSKARYEWMSAWYIASYIIRCDILRQGYGWSLADIDVNQSTYPWHSAAFDVQIVQTTAVSGRRALHPSVAAAAAGLTRHPSSVASSSKRSSMTTSRRWSIDVGRTASGVSERTLLLPSHVFKENDMTRSSTQYVSFGLDKVLNPEKELFFLPVSSRKMMWWSRVPNMCLSVWITSSSSISKGAECQGVLFHS